MKIPEYENVNLTGDELFLVEDGSGTATIKAKDILNTSNILETLINDPALPVPMRRNIYRGKNLGTSVTEEQKKAIRDGTFEGLAIGDYWSLNNNYYIARIMDFNYYKTYNHVVEGAEATDDFGVKENHVVIVPDESFTEAYLGGYAPNPQWTQGSNYLETGYANCIFRDYVMNSRLLDLGRIWGSRAAISKVKEALSNAITTLGRVSSIVWTNEYVMLPTNAMIFGNRGFDSISDGGDDNTYSITGYGLSEKQLAGFRLNPGLIKLLEYSSYYNKMVTKKYWLRDPASKNAWCIIDNVGSANRLPPGTELAAVREVYCLNGNW